MTKLTKPVRRWVESGRRGLVVALYPNGTIGIRERKRRLEHTVTMTHVFKMAAEVTAERIRQERVAARNARRQAKGLPPLVKKVRRGLL